MLLTEKVEVKWHYKTKEYYINKGYIFTKNNDPFLVTVDDLFESSTVKVDVQCDYCAEKGILNIVEKEYKKYLRGRKLIDKDACEKCIAKKRKDCCVSKYGVECTFQLEEIKKKSRETQIQKYGDLYSKTNDRKMKIKNTNIKNYGVENPMQRKEIKEKAKETNIERYGCENPFQNKEVQQKHINTLRKKHNDESLINVSQTPGYREKFRNTSLERFGTEHPFQNKEIQKKIKETIIKRYGVESPQQNAKIREKTLNTLANNGNVNTSSQQLYVYNLLRENGYEVELNYKFSKSIFDIALFYDGYKIDIEYDCEYWHEPERDRKRDEFTKSKGWKIIRIIAGRKTPSLEQLEEKIKNVANYNFQAIILEEWKDRYYE